MSSQNSAVGANRVVIDPVTRIEGHLRVEVELADGKVKNAWSSSQLFRGLEIILKGRDPRDAYHFTQRACGVCTYVHSLASIRCVDDAVKASIPENARLVRNLLMGAQFLHDHIVHFYHLHALDWVDVISALKADPKKAADVSKSLSANRPETAADFQAVQERLKKFVDAGQLGIFSNAYFLEPHPAYKLPPEVNLVAAADYLKALRVQVEAAKMMAIFGGKNPHPQSLVVGGVTCYDSLTPEAIGAFRKLLTEVSAFVNDYYIPDLLAVAGFYKDWGAIGGTSNFHSGGDFGRPDRDVKSMFFPQGVIYNRDLTKVADFDPKKIMEHVKYSWYQGEEAKHPAQGVTDPAYTGMDVNQRYSWMKAPRYDNKPTEVGPLARVLVAYARGDKQFKGAVDGVLKHLGVGPEALFSTLGRTAARGVETTLLAAKTEEWLNQLEANVKKGDTTLNVKWNMPDKAMGVGFAEVPRGALSHWIEIEGKKIKNFQLVVPSTWNLGPRDGAGQLGPLEEALIGTPVADPKRPVEIIRTMHAFDPCIACGVHVIDSKTNEVYRFRVL